MAPVTNNNKKLDPSTLNFNKVVEPEGQTMFQNRFTRNFHVRQTDQEINSMIIPRGIDIRIHGANIHKNKLAEGSLITLFWNNINPNELCRREQEEVDNFISNKLKIIRENPYELKGVKLGHTKLITEIDNEEKAQKAYNLVKEGRKIFGNL